MSLSQTDLARLEAEMQSLKEEGTPFAMATVVRTVDSTSASPGGKALIDEDGTILMGWVGGGCARGAVGRAAREAISEAKPQFISLRPQEALDDEGIEAGETRDGAKFARNGCPSKGTMDIFVEPVLPLPRLDICGTGLVAMAIADLGARLDFRVTLRAREIDDLPAGDGFETSAGFDVDGADFIVVATQGQGDKLALEAALEADPSYLSFVGSSRKFATLSEKISAEHPAFSNRLGQIRAPAGLDINAITPEEIALSILAEITKTRRAKGPDRGIADD